VEGQLLSRSVDQTYTSPAIGLRNECGRSARYP